MATEDYRIETVVRSNENIIRLVLSSEFDLIFGAKATAEHASALRDIADNVDAAQSLTSIPKGAKSFWDSVWPPSVTETMSSHIDDQLTYHRERMAELEKRIDEVKDEREYLFDERNRLKDELDGLRDRFHERESALEAATTEIDTLKKKLDEVTDQRDRLLLMERSDSVAIIRQWIQDQLMVNPKELVRILLNDGVTSEQLAEWGNAQGYETNTRSIGNSISKHPELREILSPQDNNKPARWIIDLDSVDSKDLELVFGSRTFVKKFLDHVE